LRRRPSVSPLPTLPSTLPGGPTGAGTAGSGDAGAGAISGRGGRAAAGGLASGSRFVGAAGVAFSPTKTYRVTKPSPPRASSTPAPLRRAGGPPSDIIDDFR